MPYPNHKTKYDGHNVIEWMLGRLKNFRRIAIQFDENIKKFPPLYMPCSNYLLLDLNGSGS